MRSYVLIVLVLAGCWGDKLASYGSDPAPDDMDPLPGQAPCTVDEDCRLAAATCCECPAFAVSKFDPKYQACRGVECPDRDCAENVTARCSEDLSCELGCAPAECAITDCPAGYAIDQPTGCLSCACAVPQDPPSCAVDTDCVRTRADCCGCVNGGTDTAVPASEQAAYDEMLQCESEPQCPGVNSCEIGAAPQCVQGSCELLVGGLPPKACGRADLMACGAGEVCMVNVNDQADMHGVGICQPAP
ncbi:MAG TPA: hypothetical protein VIU61_03550 [Kofleriaceae bacterium]